MQQRNGYSGANSTFVNASMTLNSFQVGVPPEIVCVFVSFLFVLGVCFIFGFFFFLQLPFNMLYCFVCVCFRNWPIRKSVKTFSLFVFGFGL